MRKRIGGWSYRRAMDWTASLVRKETLTRRRGDAEVFEATWTALLRNRNALKILQFGFCFLGDSEAQR